MVQSSEWVAKATARAGGHFDRAARFFPKRRNSLGCPRVVSEVFVCYVVVAAGSAGTAGAAVRCDLARAARESRDEQGCFHTSRLGVSSKRNRYFTWLQCYTSEHVALPHSTVVPRPKG